MSRYGRSSYGYFSQPSAYELQSMGEEYIRKQAAKGIILHPVCAKSSSRNICQSWWGISWCNNLERYADDANRLARGRKYTRSGAILDLQISKGVVTSIVQGSSARPYKITIRIDPLSDTHLKKLEDTCFNKVKNLDELLAGKFPDDLKNVFFDKDGLFPTPREIHFDCSCPDWASMCKHVAAAMYGIGLRLDEDPMGFFVLRGLDPDKFIARAVESRVSLMLKNAKKKSTRIIDDQDVDALFGVF